ncbi:hypothetical protein AXG93_725s1130 [Marchantia polymorpha subsp. ruderalis]|uniref:Uncharacterized protein n=1 Tax=Marchantia polymorpha subsp. ruderalis TaxID=1480154 RepID=A0A176WET1_MARPO|nr:hypothetical protein AXG93_725s1130 [Marchantia polymorpha subsp. ruderalis]
MQTAHNFHQLPYGLRALARPSNATWRDHPDHAWKRKGMALDFVNELSSEKNQSSAWGGDVGISRRIWGLSRARSGRYVDDTDCSEDCSVHPSTVGTTPEDGLKRHCRLRHRLEENIYRAVCLISMAKPAADIRWRLMLVCAVFAAGKIGFLTPVNGQTSNRCPRAFFNFGTSLTDTGNILNEFPFSPEITKFADPENPPYGDAFFRRPAKRYCNGRLIPDFISLAFDVPLLDAYTSPTVFNFRHGLNFAGDLVGVSSDGKSLPLFLPLQIKQFIRFKSSALTAQSQVECLSSISSLPPRIHFQEGLYTLEFGSSDIRSALQRGLSTASILQNIIPAAVKSVLGAVQILYQYEARNFLIYNIFPQGCSPQILTLLDEADLTKDDLGCIAEINQLDEAYNSQLFLGLEFLRASLPDTNIILFDFYNATIEMLRNPSEYGTCCSTPNARHVCHEISIVKFQTHLDTSMYRKSPLPVPSDIVFYILDFTTFNLASALSAMEFSVSHRTNLAFNHMTL